MGELAHFCSERWPPSLSQHTVGSKGGVEGGGPEVKLEWDSSGTRVGLELRSPVCHCVSRGTAPALSFNPLITTMSLPPYVFLRCAGISHVKQAAL